MAHNRWTLALILIFLPILATVITAFRIRDFPKSYDSSKLNTKKTQPCENCDVKVGQKVHSVKIESDERKNEELKKAVREKQQLNEKASDSKSSLQYNVRSDEDDGDDEDSIFSKIEIGFRQEYPINSRLDKIEFKTKSKINDKKSSVDGHTKDSFDKDEDANTDGDSDVELKKRVILQPKITEIKKVPTQLLKIDTKSSQIKTTVKIQKTNNQEIDDDDNEDKRNTVAHKPKETKYEKSVDKPKDKLKSSQLDMVNKQKLEKNIRDDDEEDDDDEDDYEGLENIDELFKILDMKRGSKSKAGTNYKTGNEIKSQKLKEVKKKDDLRKNIMNNENESDGDDEDDDDDDKDVKVSQESKLKKGKDSQSPLVQKVDSSEITVKKSIVDSGHPSKSGEISKKDIPNEDKLDVIKYNKDTNLKATAIKTNDAERKNETQLEKNKTTVKKNEHVKIDNTVKSQTVTMKEDKKEQKESKIDNEKTKNDKVKKIKEAEDAAAKSNSQVKDTKSITSHDSKKVDKNIINKPDNEQTDPKVIFKVTEQSKEIKYDFEKPNAYKDSHKNFDYSEFEKLQVFKTHHKEKKTEKSLASGERNSDSREEKYLKHVTDALNRRNLLKSEFEDFYAFFPTFAPNFSRIHNPECRRHGQILLRQLRGTKLWALNMLDATAKIPSGVLQGNGIQLGDFDQCLGSRARVKLDTGSVVKVQGKYCLARLDVKAEHTELEAPVYLAQAKSLIRSRIDDPGHFVPRFSTLSWGVCVPSACDSEDVEVIIKDAVKHYQHKSGVLVKVKVDESDCHTDDEVNWEEWLEWPTVLTLAFYGVVILLVLVATVQDFIARRQPEESQKETEQQQENNHKDVKENNKGETKKQSDGFLSSFSLYRTFSKLIAPGTTDEISCIHGIRGIATAALLIAHKFMPVAVMPYTNRLKITEMVSSPLWSWCRAGWIFTDCFLLLSGTLTAHRIVSDNDTGALRRLFSRYLRLTPALLAVVLFYAYVWDKLSTGPMWGTFVTKNAEVCQQGWWWNLLYVQNYFGLEDMCAPQTHQLALDMQLTILGGIILWAVQSEFSFAKLILPGLHLLAAYFRYTTVSDHRLTLLAYHGVSVSQLYRTARLSYTSTLHRCSPYLIGLSLGLALKKTSKHGKFLLTLGWLTSIALAALVLWSGLDSGSTQYRYNATFAARYATIAPIASAMAIAWVIYAVHSGTCDFLSRFLCWRTLVFISRLSYALYLCQFIVFITNIGTVRTSKEFTFMSLVDMQEISAILLVSTIFTVTFVIPMQSLHKIFSFNWKTEAKAEIDDTESRTENEIKIEDRKETTLSTRIRHNLVAHREVLEEIPEVEIEYESHRENTDGLDEIIEEEEEEGTICEEEDQIDDLEIIEEEEAGEEEAWLERDGERTLSRGDDQDDDEWEWTANGSGRSGAQYYRYAR